MQNKMLPMFSFLVVIATALLTLSFLYTMQNSGTFLDSSAFDKLPVKLASYQLNTSFFWDGVETMKEGVETMKESLITTSAMPVVLEATPLSEVSLLETGVLLGTKKSNFAYITLLHGVDKTFSYRGFLYNALIMKQSLIDLGSKADFIIMIGFTTTAAQLDYQLFKDDISLLENAGFRIFYLPRLRPEKKKVDFMEMALLKITPWNLMEYEKIQYFDGDVLPRKNMDCFFKYETDTFNTGNASPLNSGWFLCIPNPLIYNEMLAKAVLRIETPWDEEKGWGTKIPKGVTFRGGSKKVKNWNFNGASLDQGLLFDTYAMHGTVTLIDVNTATKYSSNGKQEMIDLKTVNKGSNGKSPTQFFIHYTGAQKPWLQKLKKVTDKNVLLWFELLDKLNLTINSKNSNLLRTKIPLGLFAANK